jgi:hypothetical protein
VSGDPEWYRIFAAVRSRTTHPDPHWRDRLRADLADASWRDGLDATGELRSHGGRPIGRYHLLEVSEVEARWGGADWFDVEPPCRFAGPVTGFLNWESWMDAETELGFAKDLLWATRGYLARTDRDERFDALVEEDFPLRDAASKHGFHDGDFFLDDVPGYAEYVRDRIVAEVAALGLEPELFNGGTSHNPHRINQFVPRKTQTFASAWATFHEHENDPIRLWGYNWTGMRSPQFAAFISDPIPSPRPRGEG